MITVGLEVDTRAYFTAVTVLISLPTGTKIFNWLSTYMGSNNKITMSSTILALSFILLFTLGGTTGVILGNAAVDVSLHDTYYVCSSFPLRTISRAIVALITGVIFFQETFFGTQVALNSVLILWGLSL